MSEPGLPLPAAAPVLQPGRRIPGVNTPSVHLRYQFGALPRQRGGDIANPLFELLQALRSEGSISGAAKGLGQSYRHVWGELKTWEAELGDALVLWSKGRHARLTPFAERLLWAEQQARARMTPHVEALRTELQRVFERAADPALLWLDVAASHDLALPLLQDLAQAPGGTGALHLNLRFSSSQDALRQLNDGACTVAGFHVPRLQQGSRLFRQALRPLLKPGLHKLIGTHWRRQGLMLRPGSELAESGLDGPAVLTRIAQGRGRFVNRQTGSGTRLLLEHLLAAAGLDAHRIDGFETRVEHTHLGLAAAVAAGAGDAGLGVEAAARHFGLLFQPLVEEDYFLVCLKPALALPALQALQRVLAQPAWADALATLPGHGTQRPGEVLSLTRALPWWRFADAGSPAAPRTR